jgi:hypothetical protein
MVNVFSACEYLRGTVFAVMNTPPLDDTLDEIRGEIETFAFRHRFMQSSSRRTGAIGLVYVTLKEGDSAMGDTGKKDKGKKEKQKKAQRSPKEKRKDKKEKRDNR